MIHQEIEKFNNSTYEDAKIFNTNSGYTSKLIQRLYSFGYRAGVSGCVHTLYDDRGIKVCTAYSWPSLLMTAAKVLS